jgi:hypothetical protein
MPGATVIVAWPQPHEIGLRFIIGIETERVLRAARIIPSKPAVEVLYGPPLLPVI